MNEIIGNSKKVLLIGKNSYIGKKLIEYCDQNNSCVPSQDRIEITAVSGKSGDFRSLDFSSYDSVILLSGIVHQKAQPELYYEVNLKMAVEIAKKAKEAKVKQFIFMSTIAVYGDQLKIIDESVMPNPVTDYAKSKYMAENEIRKLMDKHFGVFIVRPPMVYGSQCPGNFARLVHLIHKFPLFPVYRNQRCSIYIENLCIFLEQIIQKSISGYCIPQNADNLCTMDIAKCIKQNGSTVWMVRGFKPMIILAMKINRSMGKMFGDFCCSQKLSKIEGVNYQRISTIEGIQKSIK